MGETISGSCSGMSKQDAGIFSTFLVQYGFGVEVVECGVLTTSCWFGCRDLVSQSIHFDFEMVKLKMVSICRLEEMLLGSFSSDLL